MAKRFLVPINLEKNDLLNAAMHPSTTAPATPVKGQLWFDTNTGINKLKVYDGTSWITLADAASTGITDVDGTANQIEVSVVGGVATVSLPSAVTMPGSLTVTGNLTVSGTTTTVNSETLTVNDNIIVLNNNVTGTPTENAGIEIERGTSTNASLIWDETADKWEAGLAGAEVAISLEGHTHTSSNVTDFTEAAQDAAASMFTGATHSGVSVSYNDAGNTLAITNTGVTSVNGNSGSISPAQLLAAIVTVDGASSGLDADLLDGNHASAFALTGHNHTVDSLSNVVITTNSDNEVLAWDSATSKWINQTAAEAGLAAASHTHTLSAITDVTATAAELNVLDGITATTTELNYTDGVTSNIQTQLDGKASTTHNHTIDSLSNVVITANTDNEVLAWDSTTSKWINQTAAEAGLATSGHTHTAGSITDFNEAAADAVGGILTDTSTIDFTYNDAGNTISAAVILNGTSYLSTTSGLAVDVATLETKLVTDSFTKKYAASVGDGTNTTYSLTHGLNTRDVTVNVYDNSTYETIECDVIRTSTSQVTVGFSTAPAANAYRVVIVG